MRGRSFSCATCRHCRAAVSYAEERRNCGKRRGLGAEISPPDHSRFDVVDGEERCPVTRISTGRRVPTAPPQFSAPPRIKHRRTGASMQRPRRCDGQRQSPRTGPSGGAYALPGTGYDRTTVRQSKGDGEINPRSGIFQSFPSHGRRSSCSSRRRARSKRRSAARCAAVDSPIERM